jgi:hypothetical protein
MRCPSICKQSALHHLINDPLKRQSTSWCTGAPQCHYCHHSQHLHSLNSATGDVVCQLATAQRAHLNPAVSTKTAPTIFSIAIVARQQHRNLLLLLATLSVPPPPLLFQYNTQSTQPLSSTEHAVSSFSVMHLVYWGAANTADSHTNMQHGIQRAAPMLQTLLVFAALAVLHLHNHRRSSVTICTHTPLLLLCSWCTGALPPPPAATPIRSMAIDGRHQCWAGDESGFIKVIGWDPRLNRLSSVRLQDGPNAPAAAWGGAGSASGAAPVHAMLAQHNALFSSGGR